MAFAARQVIAAADPAPASPALRCDHPRLAGEQHARIGRIEAAGPHLALVGDWSWLPGLLLGSAQLSSGRVELCGDEQIERALARGRVGVMPADAALPDAWRVREVAYHSARLLGHGPLVSSLLARQALGELGLESWASRRLGQLDAASKRAVCLALAIVGDPPLLVLDQPLSGLGPDAVRRLVELLSRAMRGRQALVTVESIGSSPEQDSLLAAVAEVLVLDGAGLAARGALAELSRAAASYRVVVSRGADALRAELGALGFEISALAGAQPGALRVDDPLGHGTSRLLGAAAGVGAPVLELSPLQWQRLEP